MQLVARLLFIFCCCGLIVVPGTWGQAQPRAKGQCILVGVTKTDRVGKAGAYPDEKADAVFSLSFPPDLSTPPISDIEIRAVSGPPGIWRSGEKRPGVQFLGVARSHSPSDIINRGPTALKLDPKEDKQLLLFATDDGHFSRKDRAYSIKVLFSDGTSWTAPVSSASAPSRVAPPPESATYPVRMSAVLKGISRYDAVGIGGVIAGDDRADGLFVLTIEAANREITAIEIRNTNGRKALWDTVAGSTAGRIGVAFSTNPTRLLNARNGTVRVRIKDSVTLNLYVADNGSIAEAKTDYRVTVTYGDGQISWCPVKRENQPIPEKKESPPGKPREVNFLGTWLGFVSTDSVGRYHGMKPDNEADAVFGLDIEIKPTSQLTGVEIDSLGGTGTRWSTSKGNSDTWGLGVAYQNSPSVLLNKPDGSLSIPVGERAQFFLYAADPGELATSSRRLRMIVHLADGSSFQQVIQRPVASTSSVVPGAGEPKRAMGLITCEFRGFIADLVNTSTRPGKDGYLDGTFITKLKVDNKKVSQVVVKDANGAIRWSSLGKAPAMFLGVALYPKIYELANPKGGPMAIPVSGRRTLYLYAADNGLLSDPLARLSVTVTFTDKTTLSAQVIK